MVKQLVNQVIPTMYSWSTATRLIKLFSKTVALNLKYAPEGNLYSATTT